MHKLTCIICPKGCQLVVDEQYNVTGNSCNRGKKYAIDELTHPVRMVTSTVKITSGMIKRCPVVTSTAVPKEKIFAVMQEINKVTIEAPTNIGDVVIKNVLNLGIDVVATRNIYKIK